MMHLLRVFIYFKKLVAIVRPMHRVLFLLQRNIPYSMGIFWFDFESFVFFSN